MIHSPSPPIVSEDNHPYETDILFLSSSFFFLLCEEGGQTD